MQIVVSTAHEPLIPPRARYNARAPKYLCSSTKQEIGDPTQDTKTTNHTTETIGNRTPWDLPGPNSRSATRYGSAKRNRRYYNRVPIENRLLKISGLEFSVLQEDLEELFQAVGPIQKCWIDFDRTDRSLGTGGVVFEAQEDALRARELYNGRSIDGSVITIRLSDRGGPNNNNYH